MEEKLIIALINAGVGGVIAALIIFLAYRLLIKLLSEAGGKISGALTAQAEALTRQAASMEGLTDSIKEFVQRDNNEHKEIIVMLKLIWDKMSKQEGESGS